MKNSRWLRAAVLLLAGSCMPPIQIRSAFSSRFQDNVPAQVRQVFAALPATASVDRPNNALGVPILVGAIHGAHNSLALFDLAATRQVWNVDLNASSSPYILGDMVVVGAGSEIVGLDLRTGQRRWSTPLNSMSFMGAARGGDTIVLVATVGANGNGTRVGRVIAVDAHSGSEHWAHQLVGIFGRPAVAGGFAFIPWDRQSIAAIDLESGVEKARIRATDDTISWVFATSEGVYYGGSGAYRWTPRSSNGTRADSPYLANPLQGVPGDPPLYRDGFAATTGTRTARDKIRFAFAPQLADHDGIGVTHGTIYLAYYRFIIAVNANTGDVRWARAIGPDDSPTPNTTDSSGALEAARRAQATFSLYDVESISVTPHALVVVAGNGRIRALDPNTGALLGMQDVHTDIAAIAVDAGGYHAPATGAAPAPDGDARQQLVTLIRDTDNRLVPIRAYLVRLLGHLPEQEVTRDLLDLYRQRSIPTSLRQEIATALRARRNGGQFLLAALEGEQSHYNFLENRQAPPLEVIAPTLAAMGAREAVPVLLQHMLDHETPLSALPAVINAIAELGDASAIPQLQAYIERYKADSAFAGDKDVPLQTAAAGIFRLGDATARNWLTALSQDHSAHEPLRTSITRLFEDERTGSQQRNDETQLAQAREVLQGKINSLRAAITAYPTTLTNDAFNAEWNNHLDEMRECAQGVLTRLPNLNQIRIEITLRSEASLELFQTSAPSARLPNNPTIAQQIHAVEQQSQWADHQLELLNAHQSMVRTIAYSPQDQQMRQCLDHVLRPAHFPGFGRGIATRTFQQNISTVRARVETAGTPGFGSRQGSSVLVPWFLVSSPSINPQTGLLIASTPATTGTDAHPSASTAPASGQPSTTHSSTRPNWAESAGNEDSSASPEPSSTPQQGAPTLLNDTRPLNGRPRPQASPAPAQTPAPAQGGTRPWWEQ